MIMGREFSPREKFLLLLLVIVFLIGAYYLGVHLPVKNQLEEAELRKEELHLELTALRAQRDRMDYMQKVIAEKEAQADPGLPLVAPYDNFTQMMDQLNGILAGVADYSLTFDPVVAEGALVRRPVLMSFTAASYARAQEILRSLEYGRYRCQISDLTIMGTESGVGGGPVSVSATVTFFETTEQN